MGILLPPKFWLKIFTLFVRIGCGEDVQEEGYDSQWGMELQGQGFKLCMLVSVPSFSAHSPLLTSVPAS